MKYKLGDKVRVRRDLNCEIECLSGVMKKMLPFAEKEVTILTVFDKAYKVDADCETFFWNDEMFESAVPEFKIEGFRSKNATVCLMKKDGKVIAKGVAKCCPDDDYDFEFGIRLAFFRMMGLPTDEMTHDGLEKVKVERFKNNEFVRIKNVGKLYDTYNSFVAEFAPEQLEHYAYGKRLNGYEKEKDIYKILAQHNHLLFDDVHLLILKNVRTDSVYVIDEKGVEKFDLEAVA